MAVRSAVINVMAPPRRRLRRGLIREFGEVEKLQVLYQRPGRIRLGRRSQSRKDSPRRDWSKARPGLRFLARRAGAVAGTDQHHAGSSIRSTADIFSTASAMGSRSALQRDGEIIAGMVYEPLRDEASGQKRRRRLCQRSPSAVSARRELGDAVIGTGIPSANAATTLPTFAPSPLVMAATSGVRRRDSPRSISLTSRRGVSTASRNGYSLAEIAAGILLVREAAATSRHRWRHRHHENRQRLAANDHLLQPLARLLKRHCNPQQSCDGGGR